MTLTPRERVLARVADHLLAREAGHPLRVGVDGITAAGKTTFARELAAAVAELGRPALHLSTDDYHHRRERRHRQGRDSAIGYYEDAYDLDAFHRFVLTPLGPDGDRRYRARLHDLSTDEMLDDAPAQAETDAVVIVDGSFLQRRELAAGWDEIIFLVASLDAARARGVARDAEQFGGPAAAQSAYRRRYHGAAELYLAEHTPIDSASVVIDNDTPARPRLLRIGGGATSTTQLFSYGALQQPGVQLSRLGRLLGGVYDTLPGYRTDWLTITDPDVIATSGSDRRPILRTGANPGELVSGTLLTLTSTELATADEYEADAYRRRLVTLGSGRQAWAYLAV